MLRQCPKCLASFKGMTCPACRAARQRAGILLHQRRFLQTWKLGQLKLLLATKDGVKHVQLFDDRWHSYCGIELFGIMHRDRVDTLPDDLCSACRPVFQHMVAWLVQGHA